MAPGRPHHTFTARGAFTVLAGTALIGAALTGCSKDSAPEAAPSPSTTALPSPSATQSPSPTTDPQAAEKAKVLAAYHSFWAESVKAYAAGSDKGTQLVKYAANKALDEALTDLANQKNAGFAMQGAPGHRAETTALDMSGEHPRATVADCLDLSTWRTVDRANGKEVPYPSGQPLRYVAVAEVEQWAGQWMVVAVTPNGDRTC
ncbi:hypothetical protein [Streptomyces sp. NPDC089799]|uniref:hypothetical protein n=1 Tax=Streptomyces sp. NPDC089799 TaxID=3155066 RepID=UPI003439F6F4